MPRLRHWLAVEHLLLIPSPALHCVMSQIWILCHAKAARYAVGGKAAQPTQHGRATDPPRRQPATISLGFSTGAESASDDSDTSLDSELDDIPLASAWELE